MQKSKDKKTIQSDKIVGRLIEQKLLKELFESKKAEFIAVYGRRRSEKHTLLGIA